MKAALILAGGDIRHKLQSVRAAAPSPALLPVHTRPLAAYAVEFYLRETVPVHLYVAPSAAPAVARELGPLSDRISLHALPATAGVVDTLRHALDACDAADDIIVNLVTTVPTVFPQPDEVFLANESDPPAGQWSGLAAGDGAAEFSLKSQPLSRPIQAFTGVFRANRADLAAALARTRVADDLFAVVRELHALSPRKFRHVPWIDCGHEANYFDARAQLINSRSFNRVRVDTAAGTVTKSSRDPRKLLREAQFTGMLPESLSLFFPRLLRSQRTSADEAEIVMEYYGYPTLAEYQLYWDLDELHWRRTFRQLGRVLSAFRRHPYSIGRAAHDAFYLHRIQERTERFRSQLAGTRWASLADTERLTVNGHRCRNLSALRPALARRIADLYREADFCVMHGDFCFNNILYDVASGVVRLIDPRGSFGDSCIGIYGDRKYDLAKLLHSSTGGYDYFANELFQLEGEADDITLRLNHRDNQACLDRASAALLEELEADPAEIALLTAFLFVSMAPLHADSLARQVATYAHGIRLLNLALES